MEAQDSEQAGATLLRMQTLANAANAEGERDEAPAPSAGANKKYTQYQPITDEAELEALRAQGLTDKGLKKVAKGDLRCRPPRVYSETFFDKKLPQFRLQTVVETARAEDVVMTWAFVTQRDTKLRANEFRFDPNKYLEDEALVADLKVLGNSSDAMMAYLKNRFGTLREPRKQPSTVPTATTTATATVYHGSFINSYQQSVTLPSSSQPPLAGAVPVKLEGHAPEEEQIMLTIKTAREYIRDFREGLLKQQISEAKKKGKTTEGIVLTEEEEKECEVRALHKAAWDGQAKAAFDLATRLNDFNAILNFNYTPLHQAVLGSVGSKRRTNFLTAERLIKSNENGADVNAKDIFGRTPLHHASRRGDLEMMNLLITKGAEVNAVAFNGCTPLHCAAESGGKAAVQKLLDAGAEETPSLARIVDLAVPTRQNSLGVLSDLGSIGLARQASRLTSDGSIIIETPVVVQECGTALHWAARAGQDEAVDLLLQKSFNVNALDWHGTTPLQAAAREYKDVFPDRLEVGDYRSFIARRRKRSGLPPTPPRIEKGDNYLAVMRYLLGYRADKEAMDIDGRTALHVAAACGNLKCVKLLLSGKDNTMCANNDMLGYNPLMLTVIKSEEPEHGSSSELASIDSDREFWKGVDALMGEWNVDDNTDKRGRTALHLAVLGGKTKVAEHLIERKAQVDAKDDNGATPLLLAARAQQRACVELLLRNDADANAMDKLGCTSLCAAALAGDIVIVDLLLEKGAAVNQAKRSENGQAGDEGRTALHDAAEAGDRYIVDHLIEHGADITKASDHKKTPLHVAARYGNTDVVQALIDALKKAGKAEYINAEDCKGRTALKVAEQHGLTDVVALLKQEAGVSAATERSEQLPASEPCADGPEDAEYRDWESRFKLLKSFASNYERVPAPDEWFRGYPLGSWVELQKEKLRWGEMAEEEFAAIGSVGNYLKDWGAGIPWMDWLQNVKEFVAANDVLPSAIAPKQLGGKRLLWSKGPTSTRKVDPKLLDLGWWCKFQQCRRAGKVDGKEKSSLDSNQIKELEALRQWRWESPDDRIHQRAYLTLRLHLFCAKYKRFPRPDEHYLGVPLGEWWKIIRKLKLWGDLPKQRQEHLEQCVLTADKTEIFPGSSHDIWNQFRPTLNDYLDSLATFVRENKRIPTQRESFNSVNMGSWLASQTQKWRQKTLTADEQHRIEGIFKSHSVPFSWPIGRNSAGGTKDVEMQEAAALAVAAAAPGRKKTALPATEVKAELKDSDADSEIELDLTGESHIARKIRSWMAKTSESIELKSAEVLEYIQSCRQCNLKVVKQIPSQPAAGSTFFLQRSSKFRQDGYKWKKESRSLLKVNGEDALQCCYANTTDGTLQRRIYWELERPNSLCRDLVFVHYIDKNSSPAKRVASQSQQAAEVPVPERLEMLCEVSLTAATKEPSAGPSKTKKKRIRDEVEVQPFDEIIESPSDLDESSLDKPEPKRSKHLEREITEEEKKKQDEEAKVWSLIRACETGDIAAVEKLISEGVDVCAMSSSGSRLNLGNDRGVTALMYACEHGLETIVKLLLTALEINVNVRDDKGVTALMYACEHGSEAIVQLLLEAGADIDVKDNNKWTASVYARHNGHNEILKILEEEKAKRDEAKEQKNKPGAVAAAAPPPAAAPSPSPPSPAETAMPADTRMEDIEDKTAPGEIKLPLKVAEMVASTPVDNYVAVSAALRALFDHGVGGVAMRWAALQIVGKKLEDAQKEVLFQGVKDYVAQGKLQEASDWVRDMKEDLE